MLGLNAINAGILIRNSILNFTKNMLIVCFPNKFLVVNSFKNTGGTFME